MELKIGEVRLIGVDPKNERGSVWLLDPSGAAGLVARELRGVSREVWARAATVLPRSLPVLWRAVRDAHRRVPVARHLGTWAPEGATQSPPRELDGESYGLSFVLSLASTVLGVPLRPEVAASATVDEFGDTTTKDVAGLHAKIQAIRRHAPQVRTLLVPAHQKDEAEAAAADSGIKIVPIRSAGEALKVAFANDMESALIEAGTNPERKREILRSFFALALGQRSAVLDWSPVARGASLAIERWKDLAPHDLYCLEFARAVAQRHESNTGELTLPEEAWLQTLPSTIRLAVVRHVVQQAADSGSPDVASAEQIGFTHLVRGAEAFDDHLKLLGALGRLYAVTGRVPEALGFQREAAKAWIDRMNYGETSFPLCEWIRLAGVSGLSDEFGGARASLEEADLLGNIHADRNPYLRLAIGRAAAMLGDLDTAWKQLDGLPGDVGVPVHVRAGAARWQALIADENSADWPGVTFSFLDELEAMKRAGDPSVSATAGKAIALVNLDRAVRRSDEDAAHKAIAGLRELEPYPVSHLLQVAPATPVLARAGYVRRHYPY